MTGRIGNLTRVAGAAPFPGAAEAAPRPDTRLSRPADAIARRTGPGRGVLPGGMTSLPGTRRGWRYQPISHVRMTEGPA